MRWEIPNSLLLQKRNCKFITNLKLSKVSWEDYFLGGEILVGPLVI